MKRIAALLTCHNRKDKTIKCLQSLYALDIQKEILLSCFLVDDGSTDGTIDEIKKHFPQVNLIIGTGNLFWNNGMRLAWENAYLSCDFDYYFWLNDDTILYKYALEELIFCHEKLLREENKVSIITGACKKSISNNNFSYGGWTKNKPIIPDGNIQQCLFINGNAVLVPREIFKIIGNLSTSYTHSMGDFDYGLRAYQAGYYCYTTRKYIAVCPNNDGIPDWCNPRINLIKRLKIFYSPKGLNINEYILFRKRFWGNKWVIYAAKAYIKVLFPKYYKYLTN